jgi:hypothetical protein
MGIGGTARVLRMLLFTQLTGKLHPNSLAGIFRPELVDLHGGYVIPACGEAHNHAAAADHPEALKRFIEEGILYVKNPDNIPRVRQGPFLNTPDGVDVIFSNGALTAPEGHPLVLVKRGGIKPEDGEGFFYYTVDSLQDVEAKLPKLLATKPDFVKTILVYSEEYDKRKFTAGKQTEDRYFSRRGLKPALLKPIVERVHEADLKVVTHVESAADFHVAVEAGVDEINHLPGFWPNDDSLKTGDFSIYRINDQDVRQAARRQIDVVTTIGETLDSSASLPPAIREKLIALYRDNLAVLRKNRVTALLGSDQYRKSSREEVLAIASAGLMGNADLIEEWCDVTPRSTFPLRKIGALKDGYEASFVVLSQDPLQDINHVTDVEIVVKSGTTIFRKTKAAIRVRDPAGWGTTCYRQTSESLLKASDRNRWNRLVMQFWPNP